MTAPPSTTAHMLSEIESGTAAELLLGVRFNTCPPGPTFIPELDTHLLNGRFHPGGSSLRRGDLIEVTGPSGSGKTTFCVFLLLTTLLPPTITIPLDYPRHADRTIRVPLGGRGMTAAFLSPPSHRCIVELLDHSMRVHIENLITACFATNGIRHYGVSFPAVKNAIEKTITSTLSNLSIYRPVPRAASWVITLRAVPTVDMLFCDGFTDGFWPERWAEEEGPRKKGDASFRDVWDVITAIRKETGAIVVLVTHGLRPIPNTPFYKPHLPHPYPAPYVRDEFATWPLNVQITLLGRSRSLQFPAETLLADALRDKPTQMAPVYDGIVRVPDGKGRVGSKEGMRFSFAIGQHGLVPFSQ